MPHTELDKPGLNYVIQYYDINKAKIPKIAFKWMATSGLPDFIERVHKAAHKLKQTYDRDKVNQMDLISDVDLLYLSGEPISASNTKSNEKDNNLNPVSSEQQLNDKNEKEDQTINSDKQQQSVEYSNSKLTKSKILENLDRFERKRARLLETTNREFFKDDEPHPVFFN